MLCSKVLLNPWAAVILLSPFIVTSLKPHCRHAKSCPRGQIVPGKGFGSRHSPVPGQEIMRRRSALPAQLAFCAGTDAGKHSVALSRRWVCWHTRMLAWCMMTGMQDVLTWMMHTHTHSRRITRLAELVVMASYITLHEQLAASWRCHATCHRVRCSPKRPLPARPYKAAVPLSASRLSYTAYTGYNPPCTWPSVAHCTSAIPRPLPVGAVTHPTRQSLATECAAPTRPLPSKP